MGSRVAGAEDPRDACVEWGCTLSGHHPWHHPHAVVNAARPALCCAPSSSERMHTKHQAHLPQLLLIH